MKSNSNIYLGGKTVNILGMLIPVKSQPMYGNHNNPGHHATTVTITTVTLVTVTIIQI